MAGLQLRTGATATYSPMTPAAANTFTAGGVVNTPSTISQAAYGISGTGNVQLNATAAYGAVGVGIASVAILAFLWWSLPR